jgi:tetratricopeptide (TPR) repeat protein
VVVAGAKGISRIIKYIYIEDKFSFYDSGVWIYVSDQNPVLWGDILLNPLNSPLQLARALLTLKQAAIAADTLPTADEKSRFVEIAAAYRAASPKPSLPETARKFQVQAEGAVRDKDFDDAEFYFNQALEVAPWWPDGHYNRALMLAELGEYEMAILEMQNYLALVPNAPNARATQDMIYDWQRKTQ